MKQNTRGLRIRIYKEYRSGYMEILDQDKSRNYESGDMEIMDQDKSRDHESKYMEITDQDIRRSRIRIYRDYRPGYAEIINQNI